MRTTPRETSPDFNRTISSFVRSKVLGRLSQPTAEIVGMLDDLAGDVADAADANDSKTISDYVNEQTIAINNLRNGFAREDGEREKGLDALKTDTADEAKRVEDDAKHLFSGLGRHPDRGSVEVFADEGDNAAWNEYTRMRFKWEDLYDDAEARRSEASFDAFYRHLAENWIQRGTRGTFGGRVSGSLTIKVDADLSVRSAELRNTSRAEQLIEGFFHAATRLDLLDLGVDRRILYYGDEQSRHASHVIVLRRVGLPSEGESRGTDWERLLRRMRAGGLWVQKTDFESMEGSDDDDD